MAMKKKKGARKVRARSRQEAGRARQADPLQGAVAGGGPPSPDTASLVLDEPSHKRQPCCLPPIHTNESGRLVPDPWEELGLEPADGLPNPEVVREAWRELTMRHPPESDPRRATGLREARDRLLSPDKAVERRVNVLHLPDPDALDLAPAEDISTTTMAARDRLMGQLAVYALLEEYLSAPENPKKNKKNKKMQEEEPQGEETPPRGRKQVPLFQT